MMVSDHTKAGTELKALAATKKMTMPADLTADKDTIDDLKATAAADFDAAYVDAMVDGHEDTVAAFQEQADKSADAEVKAFAAKTLPTLKAHLEQIKAIQAKMP
jgi:putative membrane protein